MTEGGVDHAVVVHPEPYQDDHRYLEHCLAVGKGWLSQYDDSAIPPGEWWAPRPETER